MKKLLTILLLPGMFASSTCLFTSAGRTGGSASGKNNTPNHRAYAPRRTDAATRRNRFRRLPHELVNYMGLDNAPLISRTLDVQDLLRQNNVRLSNRDTIELAQSSTAAFNKMMESMYNVPSDNRNISLTETIMGLPEPELDIVFDSFVLPPEFTEPYYNLESIDEKRAYILAFVNFGMTIINDFIDNGNNNDSSDED